MQSEPTCWVLLCPTWNTLFLFFFLVYLPMTKIGYFRFSDVTVRSGCGAPFDAEIVPAAAFNTLVNLWMRRQVISEATRLRLFDAFVLSILTYNCGVWVLSSRDATAMDAFHRKQLRRLLGISYPEIISNTDLYARCNAEPISVLSRRARWKLFGHILRLPEATPAQVSMTAYFQRQNRGWLGRPRITLPVVIDNDLAKATSMRLRSLKDLETLRLVARNRQSFNDIIAQVTL